MSTLYTSVLWFQILNRPLPYRALRKLINYAYVIVVCPTLSHFIPHR